MMVGLDDRVNVVIYVAQNKHILSIRIMLETSKPLPNRGKNDGVKGL